MSEYLAYAAGLFDGEGSTFVNMPSASRRTSQIVMKIGMENYQPIYKFYSAVKIGQVRGPSRCRCGSRFNWSVGSKFDVGDVIKKLWPYLCEIKKKQIINSIDKYLSTPHYGVGSPGRLRKRVS